MIPMVDLQAQIQEIRQEIDLGLESVLKNCQFVLGPNVQAFEQESADYLGVKHAVGVASGTDALHLALVAAGIGAGDEVITTAFTFIATAEAIRYVGAKPVFVDIDPRTFNLCTEDLASVLSEKTAAVMPVHLFGQPANIAPLINFCERHGLKLIEDCAQSFGSTIDGKKTGCFGDAAGFSFFPSKNLGAFGDGGLVTTNSDSIAEQLKKLRNHGSKQRYYHDVIGYNSRLDEMQALVLRTKLKRIDNYNQNRRRVAHLYSSLMSKLPVETPYEDGRGVHVYHQYTLLSERRDEISRALNAQNIASAVYYPIPLHRQTVFLEEYAPVHLPVTERVAERCISLPIFPELTEPDINLIVDVIERVFSG